MTKTVGSRTVMQLNLTYHGGFSQTLVGWDARLIVGSRGSVRCHWFGNSGRVERSKPRHDFRLAASTFDKVRQVLTLLPNPLNSQIIDDAAIRRICCVSDGFVVERQRTVAVAAANAQEGEFDRLWLDLFSQVRPVLLDLGMDSKLVDEAIWQVEEN